MIWHPLVWAFWMATATGSVLYAAAAGCALDVALEWRPDRADPQQLRCERHAQMASLLGRWSLGVLTAAALLGLVGITRVWHMLVPGAMCGTGVMQAMGADGSRALIFWSATLVLLFVWHVRDGLDRAAPQGALTETDARLLIAALPFLCLALFHTWSAVMRIDGAPPVSCCAAVYDRVLTDPAGAGGMAWHQPLALWGSLAGIVILPLLAFMAAVSPDRLPGGLVASLAVIWTTAAATAVKHTGSAYYYEVLSHPCPWCLFLPDYHGVGFLIFGCLAIVLMEAMALWAAGRVRQQHPGLADPAGRRQQRAARRIIIALIGFALLTAGPAILWRLQTGTWMNGSA